jgi:MATE family multidrug resistance protein
MLREENKKTELGTILKITLPSVIANLGHMVYSLIDNLMVGRLLGAEYLASAGLAGSFYGILLPFGFGALGAISAKIAIHAGKGNEENVRGAFKESLIFSFLLGCVMTLAFLMCAPLIGYVTKSAIIEARAIDYIRILCFSSIFTMPFFAFEKASEGLGDTRISMFVIFICNILNAILNYFLILGKFGFPKMGLNGAATATVITAMCEFVIIVYFFRFFPKLNVVLVNFFKFDFNLKRFLDLVKMAVPAGFLTFFEATSFISCMFLASLISIQDMVTYQITMTITSVPFTIMYAFGSAISVRIAYHSVKKNKEAIHKIVKYSSMFTICFMVLCLCIYYLFQNQISALFLGSSKLDLEVTKMVASIIIIIGICEIFDALQVIVSASLRGLQDTFVPSILSFFCFWIFVIPAGYFLGIYKQMGVLGIWIALGSAMVLATILFLTRFIIIYKRKILC